MINSLFNDIDGNDIRLIKLSLDYLDDMWEYSSDHRMYEYFKFGPQKKLLDTKKYLNRLIERSNGVDAYWWFIQIKETGKVVGSFGIHHIDFHRITAGTSSSNVRSINALKKVGFKEEEVLRNFYCGEDGIRFDATTLSLLDFEYIPVKK